MAAMHPDLTLPQSIAKAREASGGSAQQYGQQRNAADNKVRKLCVYVPKAARPDARHNPPAVPCQEQSTAQSALGLHSRHQHAWQRASHGNLLRTAESARQQAVHDSFLSSSLQSA